MASSESPFNVQFLDPCCQWDIPVPSPQTSYCDLNFLSARMEISNPSSNGVVAADAWFAAVQTRRWVKKDARLTTSSQPMFPNFERNKVQGFQPFPSWYFMSLKGKRGATSCFRRPGS